MTRDLIPAALPLIGDEERAAVDRVMRSGQLAQGPEVRAFEVEFGDALVAGRECVAVSSGTSGLHLGLVAAGIGPGDEVVVPSFSFAATANAVVLAGATPVFADIRAEDYCLDPDAVAAAVGPRTAAVMPVHLYGAPAPMGPLQALADRHGLMLLEDAAQAHGASLGGRAVGTFGRFATFSLYPTKNMTAGEGGMNACADADVGRALRLLRNQGMERRYENEVVGHNARMTDLHAAIGRVQLQRLPAWTDRRRAIAHRYDAELDGVVTPHASDDVVHVYHQYTVRVPGDRDGFAAALRDEHGVGTGVYYPTPIHRLPAYDLELDLPETRRACGEVLSLPVHPGLTDDDVDRVITAVGSVAAAGR